MHKSAFTVPIIMPDTSELSPNQIRLDFFLILYQCLEILASGLFALKKLAPICIGHRTKMSFAIPEQPLKGVSILVEKSPV